MKKPLRIYLVGAHSTGKTTLARWIRDTYGVPMITEVARLVLAEMEAQLDALRTDIALVDRYQSEVYLRQLETEASHEGSFVSDRAFCNLAYAAQHATILSEVFADPRLRDYMDRVREGVVMFLRPHEELLKSDGVREKLDWEEVLRIDGMVKLLLEMFNVPYIPVASLAMQERIRLVERVLDLAGLPNPKVQSEGNVALTPRSPLRASQTGNGKTNGRRETRMAPNGEPNGGSLALG
jgi:nicotinamide riboside kinase